MQIFKNILKGSIAAALSMSVLSACSGSSSSGGGSSSSSALTIAGAVETVGSSSSVTPFSTGKMPSRKLSGGKKGSFGKISFKGDLNSLALSDYRVSCVTFEATPASCGDDLDSNGAFSASCSGFKNTPFGCFVYDTTTFQSFPILFNVASSGEEDAAYIQAGGGVTMNVVLDVTTGSATSETTIAKGEETGSDTVSNSTVFNSFQGTWMASIPSWNDVKALYSKEEKTLLANQWVVDTNTHNWRPPTGAEISDSAGYTRMMTERMGPPGTADAFSIYFNPSTDGGGKSRLSVWKSSAAAAACGGNENAPSWKISDGTGGAGDVTIDFSGTTQATLISSMQTALGSAAQNWFGFLDDAVGEDTTAFNPANVTVTCKYPVNLPGEFWNITPEMISACESDGTCNSGGGDTFGKVWSYKWAKLFAGADLTADPIMGTIALSGMSVADTETVAYRKISGWNSGTGQPNYVAISGTPARVDVGGCIQWSNGSATVVPVGEWFTMWRDGQEIQEKCTWSEQRMMVEDTSGWLTIGATKYVDVFMVLTTGAKAGEPVWNKACQVADTNSFEFSGTNFQTYPPEMSSADIKNEYIARFTGPDRQKREDGMKLGVIYNVIAGGDGPGSSGINDNENFWFWSGSSGGQITCAQIVAGDPDGAGVLDKNDAWDYIGKAFDQMNEPRQLARLLSCALVGVQAGAYSGVAGIPTTDATFNDANSNNVPDVFDSLSANSCIPKFQMTPVCTEDGFCDHRVICTSVEAENGGCDQADPSARMARMKVQEFTGGFYGMAQHDERYDMMFDPAANTSKTCVRMENMLISNAAPITSALSTGSEMTLVFNNSESKVCDGEDAEIGASPKMYINWVKQ